MSETDKLIKQLTASCEKVLEAVAGLDAKVREFAETVARDHDTVVLLAERVKQIIEVCDDHTTSLDSHAQALHEHRAVLARLRRTRRAAAGGGAAVN